MKLAAKFARQETETVRLARIGRRRISKEREAAVRRMLSLPAPPAHTAAASTPRDRDMDGLLRCVDCARAFKLPMHWARHRNAKHRTDVA
jgi:hypothetical protein